MGDDNWEKLIKNYGPLIGRRYESDDEAYMFFGLVHGKDDYYYGLISVQGETRLLSCVGSLETSRFKLIEE